MPPDGSYNFRMSLTITEPRPFEPGTTGWTAADLDNPQIEQRWLAGRCEIVEGVLTTKPPAYFMGGESLIWLIQQVIAHVRRAAGSFSVEVDIVLDEQRVARADAIFLTPSQKRQQNAAAIAAGGKDPKRTRVVIPPALIIECVSPGHESHDELTKRRWYADFGVPHYWLLNPFERTLACLVLRDGAYQDDVAGRDDETIHPSLFPGLSLRLGEVWGED